MSPNPLSQGGGRPPLPLGPMTGDEAYITARSQALVEVFSDIMGRPLRLVKAPSGATDTKTFVQAPLHHPEGYLVVEHELSHVLFGTNLTLMEDFRTKAVERLFQRAGWAITEPKHASKRARLEMMVQYLWNVLEDQRCCGLWGQLYPAGGELLKQRWHDICLYEREEPATRELLEYLGRLAAGVDTPTAPPNFRKCKPAMVRALNLVEGVDAVACLAITRRLIDDIGDELLPEDEDDEPSQGGQGGQGPGQQTPQQRQQAQQQAQQKIEQLIQAMGSQTEAINPSDDNGIGDYDLKPPEGKKEELSAAQRNELTRVMAARSDDDNGDGISSFSAMLQAGAEKMEDKIEQARMAMSIPKRSEEDKKAEVLTAAARVRGHLDRVRMKMRRKLTDDGDDIDVEALVAARLNDELDDTAFFEKKQREGGLDLLLLVDVSGSMHGRGIQMVEQAVADVVFACGDERVRVHLWAFSDALFCFKKLGAIQSADGVYMGGTSMVQALEVAHQWATTAKAERAIVLMTDGEPTSCRAHDSTGTPLGDLQQLLEEIRRDRIVLSVLAIGDSSQMRTYDRVFGAGKYGLVTQMPDMLTALPDACRVLVEAHILRTAAR